MEVFVGFLTMFFAGLVIVYTVDMFCDVIGSMDIWVK